MTASPGGQQGRIATLDFLRGIAVMGILLANLPAFALPESAYFSPLSWGGSSGADRVAWLANFVLIEGKMRGLFSFLFGASMLLILDRAEAAGEDRSAIHFQRMGVLFVIGCLHLYLLWWGDILSHYALVGSVAFLFARLSTRWLVVVGVMLVIIATLSDASLFAMLLDSTPRDTPHRVALWAKTAQSLGVPPIAELHAEIAAMRAGYAKAFTWRWHHATDPFAFLPIFGCETLAYMLFGMAALRSGLITGAWRRDLYRRWAVVTLGITLPAYAALAVATIAHGFDQRWIFFSSIVAAEPLRPIMVVGYVCFLILALRPDTRFARSATAAGRMALSNYLGTTLLMTFVFYGWGLGQFGRWPRAALYALAPSAWAVMLTWSPWWLGGYRHGPAEWLWRSIARFAWQPMDRREKRDEP